MLERTFQLSANQSTVGRELLAGLITFLTMSYILFVQPAVLSTDFNGQPTGLDAGAVLLATCVASALATLIMGLYANYPIALAPGMGQNFFFVSVIMTLAATGISEPWRAALGIVFIAGLAFLLLSLLGVREAIINAMSPSMRNSITVGIGLFIAFIGLKNGNFLVGNPGTLVAMTTQLLNWQCGVFCCGLFVTAVCLVRDIRGSMLWGILAATVLAFAAGEVSTPDRFVGLPEIKTSAIFKFDLATAVSLTCAPFIFVFLYMDMFDTIGTVIGVSEQVGLTQDGKLPRARQALTADAIGTVAGACMGTSTVTSYIESSAGIQQGGRTGLASCTTAALFLLALPMAPMIAAIGSYPPITAPALVLVGSMMARNVTKIDWEDRTEAIPSFLVIIGIPLSFSIADGLALGLICYPILRLFKPGTHRTPWMMYLLAAVLLAYFVFVRANS